MTWQAVGMILAKLVETVLSAPNVYEAKARAERALLAASGEIASEEALKRILGRSE